MCVCVVAVETEQAHDSYSPTKEEEATVVKKNPHRREEHNTQMMPRRFGASSSSMAKLLLQKCSSGSLTNPIQRNPRPIYFPVSERSLSTLTETPPLSKPQVSGKERGRLSRWLLFLPGAITFGLGTWQIFRRQDKVEMLEHRRLRLELEPLTFDSISSFSGDLSSLEFRRVVCEGVFDESKSIYVGPRSRSISGVTENGYYVITPLIPLSSNPISVQSPVLINRGWVPRSWRDKHREGSLDGEQPSNLEFASAGVNEESTWWKFWSRKRKTTEVQQDPPITSVEVVGVVRGSEKPSIFVPENDPSSGQWFYVDVPMIARSCGLPENTVYIEDVNGNVDPSNPYPLPKDVNTLIRSSVMPQDHLNYMLTWYSLSAAVTFMAVKRLKTKKIRT